MRLVSHGMTVVERHWGWLSVSAAEFYDPEKIALVPMGFCYPGKGKSGDLPPRPECAAQWHELLLSKLTKVRLTILIGSYAQSAYLKERRKSSLTQTVKAFREYLPDIIPIPHPSPRNRIWFHKNPWFETNLLPTLQVTIQNSFANWRLIISLSPRGVGRSVDSVAVFLFLIAVECWSLFDTSVNYADRNDLLDVIIVKWRETCCA